MLLMGVLIFLVVGRYLVVGLLVVIVGVGCGFMVNLLIVIIDVLLLGISMEVVVVFNL